MPALVISINCITIIRRLIKSQLFIQFSSFSNKMTYLYDGQNDSTISQKLQFIQSQENKKLNPRR